MAMEGESRCLGRFLLKVFHKYEENKTQEKMKMTRQKDKKLVQVQHSIMFIFLDKNHFQFMICFAGLCDV